MWKMMWIFYLLFTVIARRVMNGRFNRTSGLDPVLTVLLKVADNIEPLEFMMDHHPICMVPSYH